MTAALPCCHRFSDTNCLPPPFPTALLTRTPLPCHYSTHSSNIPPTATGPAPITSLTAPLPHRQQQGQLPCYCSPQSLRSPSLPANDDARTRPTVSAHTLSSRNRMSLESGRQRVQPILCSDHFSWHVRTSLPGWYFGMERTPMDELDCGGPIAGLQQRLAYCRHRWRLQFIGYISLHGH